MPESRDAAGVLSKNVALVVIGVLAGIGLVGSVLLHILRPDASATFIQNLIVILSLIVTAAGTIYQLGKVNEKVDEVHRQTNGNLSRVQSENERLTDIIIRAGIDPSGPPKAD